MDERTGCIRSLAGVQYRGILGGVGVTAAVCEARCTP
jgi:hypothetical protein